MASLKALLSSLKNKISGAITGSKRLKKGVESKPEGAFFDAVNQDKINITTQKKTTKGLQKFLADVWIVITLHMKGLYWVSRMNSIFIKRPPNPTEYGTMPTVMRNQKAVTNKQIMRMHDRSMKKVSGEYYMPAGRAAQIKRDILAKKAAYRAEQTQKRQSYLNARNAALGLGAATAATAAASYEVARKRATFLELKQAQMANDTGREY